MFEQSGARLSRLFADGRKLVTDPVYRRERRIAGIEKIADMDSRGRAIDSLLNTRHPKMQYQTAEPPPALPLAALHRSELLALSSVPFQMLSSLMKVLEGPEEKREAQVNSDILSKDLTAFAGAARLSAPDNSLARQYSRAAGYWHDAANKLAQADAGDYTSAMLQAFRNTPKDHPFSREIERNLIGNLHVLLGQNPDDGVAAATMLSASRINGVRFTKFLDSDSATTLGLTVLAMLENAGMHPAKKRHVAYHAIGYFKDGSPNVQRAMEATAGYNLEVGKHGNIRGAMDYAEKRINHASRPGMADVFNANLIALHALPPSTTIVIDVPVDRMKEILAGVPDEITSRIVSLTPSHEVRANGSKSRQDRAKRPIRFMTPDFIDRRL